jgi:hypothetical protein
MPTKTNRADRKTKAIPTHTKGLYPTESAAKGEGGEGRGERGERGAEVEAIEMVAVDSDTKYGINRPNFLLERLPKV